MAGAGAYLPGFKVIADVLIATEDVYPFIAAPFKGAGDAATLVEIPVRQRLSVVDPNTPVAHHIH